MSLEELCQASVAEVAELYRKGEVSPVEMTRTVLDKIERQEPTLNAYTLITRERALAEARIAEVRLRRGEADSLLCGIPIALKDIFDVEGLPMTCASGVLKGRYISARTATVAKRLAATGAVMVGKNNLMEFAYGETHPDFGHTRNPWDLERSTAGSSTGSAATVAARQAFAAIGTDTGGSIRLPAAYCGLVGLKPSYGLVSRHGLAPLSWGLDNVGPLTRTARDAAIVLKAIAGYDPDDPTSLNQSVPDYLQAIEGSLKGLRVGLVAHELTPTMDPEVRDLVRQAVTVIQSLGAEVVEVSIPGLDQAVLAMMTILMAEASTYHREYLQERPEGYSQAVRERLKMGALVPAVHYLQAQRYRATFCEGVNRVLEQVDVLVMPTSPFPANRLADEDPGRDLTPLVRPTAPFNLSGHPALSVLCGFTGGGLPAGLEIVGRPYADATVLQVAHQFQQATEFHKRMPPNA